MNEMLIDHIIGLPSNEAQHLPKLFAYAKELQSAHAEATLAGEIELSADDKLLVEEAYWHVRLFLAEYGRATPEQFDCGRLHLFPPDGVGIFMGDRHIVGGSHACLHSSILVDRTPRDILFLLVLFHEMIHLHEYSALQIIVPKEVGEDGRRAWLEEYRTGLSLRSRDGGRRYFDVIEEAVVGMFTKRYFYEVLCLDSRFAAEATRGQTSLLSRLDELRELEELADDLYLRNTGLFRNPVQVLDLIVRASVNGNYFPIARLIERTYGKGSFRELGEAASYERWHKR